MLKDSVGQEFGQDPAGIVYLSSTMSGASAGQTWKLVEVGDCYLMALEMSSYISEADTGRHLSCVPEHLYLASPCGFSR